MKQLFLTSSVHAVAHDIATRVDLREKNTLVFITTAADYETGEKEWLGRDRQSLVDAGFVIEDYPIVGKTIEQLRPDLEKFGYIYMSGGNTVYLLQQSQQTGFYELVRELVEQEGKTYIGTSAGSIIAGPIVQDYLVEENSDITIDGNEGYGFVNFTLVPHWGSDHFRQKYLGGRLEKAYKDDQIPLVLLTDNQYVVVQGDTCTLVDVTKEK